MVLLLGDGIFRKEFLEALIFALGILHLSTGIFNTCFCHLNVSLCGLNTAACGFTALFCTGQISLGLSQTQTKLCCFDDGQSVALVNGLELLKANLANEPLNSGVLRSDVLAYTGIVGKLNVAEMYELQEYYNSSY